MDKKLGRGLSAILGESDELYNGSDNAEDTGTKIDIDLIIVNKDQPRKYFDEEKLKELASSIGQHGILQPLTVRKVGNNYMLIAGERRLRACKLAKVKQVPVHVIECTDDDVLALSIIENIQRDNLNAIEEAEAFKKLIEAHGCTQENLSFTVCKSRSYISNAMRLLSLPDSVKDMVKSGLLSAGHAKLIVGLYNAEEFALECIDKKMSVRTFESFIKKSKERPMGAPIGGFPAGTPMAKYVNPEEEEMGHMISASLGLNTKLKITNNGGVLTIYCNTCEELEGLTQMLLSIGKVEPESTAA